MLKKDFFSKDKKLYDLKRNREFISWYKNRIKNGYDAIFNLDDLQRLIDFITSWFYIKYPDRFYEIEEGNVDLDFANIIDISNNMDFNEMLYRLPKDIINLILGMYRSSYSGSIPIKNEKGEILRYEPIIGVEVTKNNRLNGEGLSSVILEVRSSDGLINPNDIKKNFPMINLENINLDLLLSNLQQLKGYNLDHLNKVIFDHNVDIELRNRLIYYISLKILYNNYSQPKYNYKRAKSFNKEIFEKLNIKLDESYLDDLIREELKKENVKEK